MIHQLLSIHLLIKHILERICYPVWPQRIYIEWIVPKASQIPAFNWKGPRHTIISLFPSSECSTKYSFKGRWFPPMQNNWFWLRKTSPEGEISFVEGSLFCCCWREIWWKEVIDPNLHVPQLHLGLLFWVNLTWDEWLIISPLSGIISSLRAAVVKVSEGSLR